jgi:hypothetical protein
LVLELVQEPKSAWYGIPKIERSVNGAKSSKEKIMYPIRSFSAFILPVHCMDDNAEQLSLAEAVVEHWDKYFSSPLHFILPENVAFLASVVTLTRESALSYPSWRQTISLALFFKLCQQTFLVPPSLVICTTPL